ncbi:MAG: hypothetical protein ACKV2Q_34515 [Planctomycetaceae bacterium]
MTESGGWADTAGRAAGWGGTATITAGFLRAFCAIVTTALGCLLGAWHFGNVGRFVGYVPSVPIRKSIDNLASFLKAAAALIP